METRIIGKWTVQTAQIENAVRKNALAGVLDAYLLKLAKDAGIEDYRQMILNVRDNPALYDTITEAERAFYDTASGLGAWIPITACVSPYIPIGEWRVIDEDTLNNLSVAAMELNPHWFEIPSIQQEKKTKRKRSRSTKD